MSTIVELEYFLRDLLMLFLSMAIVSLLASMRRKIIRNLGFVDFIRAFNILLIGFVFIALAQVLGVLVRTDTFHDDHTFIVIRSALLLIGALLLFISSVMIYLPFAKGRYMIVQMAVEPMDSITYGGYWCDQKKCEETFVELVRRYRLPGLAVSRDPPEVFRKRLGLKIIPVMWISKVNHEEAVSPTRLSYILDRLRRFLESADMDKVIFVDCVEYLILENGEDSVLKFVTTLKDMAVLNRGIVLVSLDKEALDEKISNILSSELLPVEVLEDGLRREKR